MTHGSFRKVHFKYNWMYFFKIFLKFFFRIRQIYFSISNFNVNICYTPHLLFLSFSLCAPAALFSALNSQLLVLKCHLAPRVMQRPPTLSHSLGTERMAQCSRTALKSLNLYILTEAVRKKCPYCIITQVPSIKACKWGYEHVKVLGAESETERKKFISWIKLLVSSKAGSSDVLSVCLRKSKT